MGANALFPPRNVDRRYFVPGGTPWKGMFAVLLGAKSGLVPLRVLSLKRSTAAAFSVPFKILSWKKCDNGNHDNRFNNVFLIRKMANLLLSYRAHMHHEWPFYLREGGIFCCCFWWGGGKVSLYLAKNSWRLLSYFELICARSLIVNLSLYLMPSTYPIF